MKKEIKFPLIFEGKVYYNLDEIPADIKQILNEKLESGEEINFSHPKWELSEYEHLNTQDLQLLSSNLPENKSKNDLTIIPEKELNISINETEKITIKNNFGNDNLTDTQNNPHKNKFNKKDGDYKDYKLIFIVIQLFIIISLIAYIIFIRK